MDKRRPIRGHGTHNQRARPNQSLSGMRRVQLPRQTVANARSNFERYTILAKEAARVGETVEAENLLQHAEHFYRVMREQEGR
jgi:hypothetical protein